MIKEILNFINSTISHYTILEEIIQIYLFSIKISMDRQSFDRNAVATN